MKENHNLYIKRCFDLALLGRGNVSPNPLVGAVIVFQNKIIGEGYHMKYGEAHAEVNAVKSVLPEDLHLLSKSTIYINLEPCCIHGNTPPCTDLIIKNEIPKVVFSCVDQTSGVKGNSIKILEEAGIEVITGILKEQGERIISERTIFTTQQRPYVILKYAQSNDGFIGKPNEKIWLTNPISKRLVHKWRGEIASILVGTNTASTDNPSLNNRLYFGKSPLRIVFDRKLRLDQSLNLLDNREPTWVITEDFTRKSKDLLSYINIEFNDQLIPNLMKKLHDQKISSILVEGGKQILDSFIQQELWDEARVFTSPSLLSNGLEAPTYRQKAHFEQRILDDKLEVFFRE